MKKQFYVEVREYGTVELDVPEGISKNDQINLVIEAEDAGMVRWNDREIADVTPFNGWSNEEEEKRDTIYSAEVKVWDEQSNLVGTHRFDYNGTWDAVDNDEIGLYHVKEQSLFSLKRWLKALGHPQGSYTFEVCFTKNDSFGEEYLDSDEGEFEWLPKTNLLKFLI